MKFLKYLTFLTTVSFTHLSFSQSLEPLSFNVRLTDYSDSRVRDLKKYVGLMSNAAVDGIEKAFEGSTCENAHHDRFVLEDMGTFFTGHLGLLKSSFSSYGLQFDLSCSLSSIKSIVFASRNPFSTSSTVPEPMNSSNLTRVGLAKEMVGVYFYIYYVDQKGEHFLSSYNSGGENSMFDESRENSIFWIKNYGVQVFKRQ